MTASSGAGGGRDPRRARSRSTPVYRPKPDMGPASKDRGFMDPSARDAKLPSPLRNMDEFVVEAIELAGIRGEEGAAPFRQGHGGAPVAGTAMVEVVFFEEATLRSFLRVQALKRSQVLDTWVLVRRWARMNDDVELDEAVCGIVADSLNAAFPALLRASVITLLN